MDSNHRTSDGMVHPSSSSYGFFTEQALRAGVFDVVQMHGLTQPIFALEAIERQIQKERIRELLLAREMAQRRLLEEEDRIEIEMERLWELRRFQMERLSWLNGAGGLGIRGDFAMQTFMPFWPEVRSGACVGRGLEQDAAEVVFRERSPSRQHQMSTMGTVEQFSLPVSCEKTSALIKAEPRFSKLRGPKKRKISLGELEQHVQKQWGCALCEFYAASEETLKEHTQGKKHKDNEAFLRSKKAPDKMAGNLSKKVENSAAENSLISLEKKKKKIKKKNKNKNKNVNKKKKKQQQQQQQQPVSACSQQI